MNILIGGLLKVSRRFDGSRHIACEQYGVKLHNSASRERSLAMSEIGKASVWYVKSIAYDFW